jgi:hypothetical protein
MKNLKSKFNKEQLDIITGIGVTLSDDHDYSDDELMDIHDQITDRYLDDGFDQNGEPTQAAAKYESLIDFFYDQLNT